MEKPHVTITIGEKGEKKERRSSTSSNSSDVANVVAPAEDAIATETFTPVVNGLITAPTSIPDIIGNSSWSSQQQLQQTSITAIVQTPNQTIPLRIPFPINIPQYTPPTRSVSLVPPPPLSQLKPLSSFKDTDTVDGQGLKNSTEDQQSFLRKAIMIPAKLKCRMEELALNEAMFLDLLQEYEESRDLYINTLKRGYLMFFPYLLGSRWKEKHPYYALPGRKLVSLIDMFIEEKRRTKVAPEYLTKVPCNFIVTESVLKQIQICHLETVKKLRKSAFDRFRDSKTQNLVEPAQVYVEMCKRWLKSNPDIRMTTKQLISIHRMLDYENQPSAGSTGNFKKVVDPSPEIICHMADVWKLMDKEVPDQQIIADVEEDPNGDLDEGCLEIERELRSKICKTEQDEDEECLDTPEYPFEFLNNDNISVEQHQEWMNATQYLGKKSQGACKIPRDISRPRYVSRNPRLFWSNRKIDDLLQCTKRAAQQFKCQRRGMPRQKSQLQIIYRSFKNLHPRTKISQYQIMGKCIRHIRLEKRRRSRKNDKLIKKWEQTTNQFLIDEEQIEVINEEQFSEDQPDSAAQLISKKTQRMSQDSIVDHDLLISTANDLDRASPVSLEGGNNLGLGGFRLTNLNQNLGNLKVADGNPNNLNFNRDQDVLAYIKDTQNLTGKGNHGVTWTADVIADLVNARSEARRRKREWEIWATKKYGGIGIAYNNPNIHYQKVDEMFKEEWSKLRPDLSSLSVWTLVSYARKYDALKKQLIVDNGQVEDGGEQKVPRFGYRRDVTIGLTSSSTVGSAATANVSTKTKSSFPSFSIVFFANSGLPKYDLEVLDKLVGVTQELKDLILTRQLAKERQMNTYDSSDVSYNRSVISRDKPRDSDASLLCLWKEEWLKLRPDGENLAKGNLLLKRLWTLFRVGSNWTRIRPALMRQSCDHISKAYSFKPSIQDDELLHIRPRRPVFPEDEWQELLHDEDMAPHSIGNSLLLWSNLSPNPLLKKSRKLPSEETSYSKDGEDCWCWVQRQNDSCICNKMSNKAETRNSYPKKDDVLKQPSPHQKHTLSCFDRELYSQMSLALEVPILVPALDNNAFTTLDTLEDATDQQISRKSRAYSLLNFGDFINITANSDLPKTGSTKQNQGKYSILNIKFIHDRKFSVQYLELF